MMSEAHEIPMLCPTCEPLSQTNRVRQRDAVALLRGYHDDDERVLYELLVELSPPESSPFASVPRLSLCVKVPEGYPWLTPKMVAEPVPFHPNIDQDTGTVAAGHWTESSMSRLPADYLALLASPQLTDSIMNREAATLCSAAADTYRLIAVHSLGQPFPIWSPATHAEHPSATRAAIRATLLAVRACEQRAAAAQRRQGQPDAAALQWPSSQPLPDDALHRIFKILAHEELGQLCRRYYVDCPATRVSGWEGLGCRC